ncbi:MAG: hypothetical protein ACK4Z0_01540 [Sphingomonadaceae bacterium]
MSAPRLGRAGLAIALALLLPAAPASAGRSFYIDFEAGSDRADGLTPETPWKRAPGDSRAGPVPRATRLAPGDRLLFRGRVAYRGTIVVRTAGTAESPIAFIGDGWGDGLAILDGGEPAGRLARGRDGRLAATLPAGVHPAHGLFLGGRPIDPARIESQPSGSRHRVRIDSAEPGGLAHAAGRVGFLLVAGGHVEIRGFAFRHFALAPQHGPYAGHPVVALQPLPGVSLAALDAPASLPLPLVAPPPVVAIAGWASMPAR